MELNTYQQQASETAVYKPEHKLVYPVLGLAGEAGELANKAKKILRDQLAPDSYRSVMIDELGDVLWYVAAVATDLGVTLSEVARINIEKLASRKQRGTLHGSGDQR